MANTLNKKQYLVFLTSITLMSIIGLFSSDIYLPSFSILRDYFGTSESNIHETLSFYLLGLSLSQIFYGSLSDRFGRKPVLIFGTSLYVISSIACTIASDVEALKIYRLFQGIGACGGMVISRAIVSDMFPKEKVGQIFASIFPFIGASPAIAPVIGGFLTAYFGWRANFAFLSILGIVILLMILFSLKESIKQKVGIGFGSLIKNYFTLLFNSFFLRYAIIVCCAAASYFAYLTDTPFIFAKLGYSPNEIGFFYVLLAVTYIAGNLTARKSLQKMKMDTALLLGAVIFFVGGLLIYTLSLNGITSPLQLIIPISIVTFGNGFLMPFGFASSVSISPQMAGTASGLVGLMQMGSAAIASKMVGIYYEKGIQIMPIIIPILSIVALICIILVILQKKNKSLI